MIQAIHLSKHFRVTQPGKGLSGKIKRLFAPQHKVIKAVDDVSLEIAPGEIIGYLGPNGAGKSTTIKLLTGVLYPTAGMVKVNGIVPHKNRTKNAYNVGVVYGQRSQLWWDLPLIDSYEILGAMYKIPKSHYRSHLDFLVDLLQMQGFIDQPVRKLSLGQKMRGDIAASLLHEPPILYLDEPTIGLDVISKNRILQFLKDLNAEKGTTIILTTHNLSDVERVCPRIIIIDKGSVILNASQGEILERFARRRLLVVEFDPEVKDVGFDVPQGEIVRKEDNKIWIQFDRKQVSAFDLIGSLERDRGIIDVSIQEENIESIVTRIYESDLQKR
jgi:ABC-2 type transport system ATP-binding protein